MATLTAGANGTATGYSDGTLVAAFGSFTGTLGGATVNAIFTDTTTPNQIDLYTAAGSFSAVNGKPLDIDGTIYTQSACSDLGVTVQSTYTATGFSFVNTTVYAVDFAVYAGPTYVGVSTGSGGASSVPISFSSSGRTAGDRMFIAVMTANQAVPALTGWTVVTPDSGTASRGTAGAAGGVRCTVLTRVSDGTETSVTVGDSGDIQYAAGIVVRGDSGADVDPGVSIGGNAAASTSGSFTGVTTDGDNQFILTFVATDRDASAVSWTGSPAPTYGNLTNGNKRFDNGTATNTGGGVAIFTGEKLVAGATGATTATQAASAAYCWITLAVKNAAGGPATYNESLTESGTVAQTATTTATFPNARSEVATISAAEGVGLSIPVSRSEALTSAATEAAAIVHWPALTEAATSEESSTTSATLAAAATEAVTSADVGGTAAIWPTARTETTAANDNAAAAHIMPAARAENVAASDDATGDVVGGAVVYHDDLSETVTANDAAVAASTIGASRAESLVVISDQATTATWPLACSEAIVAAEIAQGSASIVSSLTETAASTVNQIVAGLFIADRAEILAANDDQSVGVSVDDVLAEAATAGDEAAATGGTEIQPPEVPANRHATTSSGLTAATTTTTNRSAASDPDLRTATTSKGRRAA